LGVSTQVPLGVVSLQLAVWHVDASAVQSVQLEPHEVAVTAMHDWTTPHWWKLPLQVSLHMCEALSHVLLPLLTLTQQDPVPWVAPGQKGSARGH
jgi:hypothetical protein